MPGSYLHSGLVAAGVCSCLMLKNRVRSSSSLAPWLRAGALLDVWSGLGGLGGMEVVSFGRAFVARTCSEVYTSSVGNRGSVVPLLLLLLLLLLLTSADDLCLVVVSPANDE